MIPRGTQQNLYILFANIFSFENLKFLSEFYKLYRDTQAFETTSLIGMIFDKYYEMILLEKNNTHFYIISSGVKVGAII